MIRPHVFGLGSEWQIDEQGLRVSVFSPFGAAGLPLGAMGSMRRSASGATTPILAAMLMPALSRARTMARSIKVGVPDPDGGGVRFPRVTAAARSCIVFPAKGGWP